MTAKVTVIYFHHPCRQINEGNLAVPSLPYTKAAEFFICMPRSYLYIKIYFKKLKDYIINK